MDAAYAYLPMVVIDSRADVRRDDPPSADEDVARLRLQLRDRSLAQLEGDGLVVYDRATHVVRKGLSFEENHPPLRSD